MGTRRFLIVLAAACALAPVDVAVAQIEEPTTVDHDASLTISPPPTRGWISGPGINCGVGGRSDCSERYDWQQTCTIINRIERCEPDAPDPITFTADGAGTGWEPVWTGCNSVTSGECSKVVSEEGETLSLDWRDVGAPAVSFVTAPTRANSNTTFSVSASDGQTSITRVEFELPGIVFDNDQTPPYTFRPDEDSYFRHGESYPVRARVRDAGGNWSWSDWHRFTFDSSAAFDSFTAAPTLTRCADPYDACSRTVVPAPPTFTFDPPADATTVGCRTEETSSQPFPVEEHVDCTSRTSFTPTIPANEAGKPTYDRTYRTLIWVHDGLNTEYYVHEWTLDRRGPLITLNSPAQDATVTAPFTLSPIANDALSPPEQVTCDVGFGFGPCTGTHDPPEGSRTIRVRAVDALGNERILARSITYDKTPPQAQFTGGPAEGAFVYSRSVTFGFAASDSVGPVTTTCKVDQGPFGTCSGAGGHSIAGLNPGIHRFTLRVVDAAGHETAIERLFVVVDPPPAPVNTTIINNTTAPALGPVVGGAVGVQAEGTAPVAPAPLAPARGRASRKFSVRRGKTTIRRLILSGLAKRSKIVVKCKGRGCFRKAKKYTARKSKLNLTRLFKRRKLSARARIEISISQKGRTTRVFRITMQKGKRKPKVQSLCLPAGASKPKRC